jgi:hypothetical protein
MQAEEGIDMSSKEVAKRPKRGPKTAEGKLAVRLNASTHGILSARPVVAAFETEKDWKAHREAIVSSIAPQGGLEEALAERVALCSWRLNRIIVFETEAITQKQESVVDDLRRSREWDSRISPLDAHPANPFSELEYTAEVYNLVSKFATTPDERLPDEAFISGRDGEALLEAAMSAVLDLEDMKDREASEAGEDLQLPDKDERRNELTENLPGLPEDAYLSDVDYTAGQLMELFEWLALRERTRDPHAPGEDSMTPGEWLLERMYTSARHERLMAEAKVEKVQKQLVEMRRGRILPLDSDLEKINRYEAHLSRQMYQALHELEALQKRRGGEATPLARVDVQT